MSNFHSNNELVNSDYYYFYNMVLPRSSDLSFLCWKDKRTAMFFHNIK